MTAAASRAWRALRLGLAFLTVVPVRFADNEVDDADLAASRFTYPLIGAFIGLALSGVSLGLSSRGVPPRVAAFLLVAAGVALTGGLHLDGLADTADGLFLWGSKDRRLAVMRDSHVGSFGAISIVLGILGKYAFLEGIDGPGRAWALLGASVVSRSLVLISAGLAGYARPEGTGRVLVEATRRRDALGAVFVVLAAGFGFNGLPGLLGSALAIAWAWGWTRWVSARLGGVTGDTLGALVETGESLFLLVVVLGTVAKG